MMRPIDAGLTTLKELRETLFLDDLADFNEYLDLKDYQQWQHEKTIQRNPKGM